MNVISTGTVTADLGGFTSSEVIMAINQSQRAVNAILTVCLEQYRLNLSQWMVIGALANGPHTPTALAHMLHVKTPYIALLLNQLKTYEGIISICNVMDDARSKTIALTPLGIDLMHRVEAELQRCLRREIAQKVAPDDLSTFLRVAGYVGENVKSLN